MRQLIETLRFVFLVLVVLATCGQLRLALAQGEPRPVPVKRQVELLLKAVALDRKYDEALEGPIVTAVIFDSRSDRSREQFEGFRDAVAQAAGEHDPPLAFRSYDLASASEPLENFLRENQIHLAWVTADLDEHLPSVRMQSRRAAVTSAGADPVLAEKGLTLAVETVGEKTRLVINRKAAAAESCDFSASLLKMSRLIEPVEPEKDPDGTSAQPNVSIPDSSVNP